MLSARGPNAAARASLNRARTAVPIVFWSALGLTLAARVMRQRYEHRRGRIHITYPNG
jgi:hypothetical protein